MNKQTRYLAYKKRNLITRGKNEVPFTEGSKKRILRVNESKECDLKDLKKRKLSELNEMMAEISASARIVTTCVIRKKQDALNWLSDHWDAGRRIVSLWFEHCSEQQDVITEERRLAYEKGSLEVQHLAVNRCNQPKTQDPNPWDGRRSQNCDSWNQYGSKAIKY